MEDKEKRIETNLLLKFYLCILDKQLIESSLILFLFQVYRNLTMPRGLVFMANYKDFVENQHTSREGSEIDVKNLSLLFSQMGYKIPKQHLNMNKMETIRALREFRSLEDLQNVDSCIVVIMSHGRDEKSFYTSDNNYLTVNDVVERFSNKECPALQKKPKIFIFQYCRGSVPDVGVTPASYPVNYERGLSVQTDAANAGETVVEKDATYTDMYIVYSTVEGFVSFRHPERGSWLMEAICDVFMNHSCDKELETLMKMVSRKVRQNYTDDGNKQVCEFVQRAFDRHFFFNPEPLNSMGSLNMSALSRVLSESTSSLEGATSPLPFPVYQCKAKLRNISQGTTPDPYLNNNYYVTRHRNCSGASNCSERSIEEFDPADFNSENVATHPRVRSLSGTRTRRRISLPEPINAQNSNCLPQLPKPWQRSFSEQTQGSRGTTPDPHELPDHFIAGNMFLEVQDEYENPSEETFDVVDNRNASWMSGASGGALPKHIVKEASVAQTAEMESLDMTGGNFPQRINEESQRTRRQGGICHSYSSTVIRQEYEDEELKDSHFKIKRQLSIPSTTETLAKINDVRKFLQVHDSDPMLLAPLQRIESFVNKKKHEGKRRKLESNSLEY
nr:LOW QUALITY PROTEIN: uncharacterized protein LOC128686445 [Cherax quadricarinatus]